MKFQYLDCLNKTIPALFIEAVKKYKNKSIYRYRKHSENFESITYNDFYEQLKKFAAALIETNLAGKHIAIISENCPEWMMAVIAIEGLRGIDIPRGQKSADTEIEYILKHSDCNAICVQNKECLDKIRKFKIVKDKQIIIFDSKNCNLEKNEIDFYSFCDKGLTYYKKNPDFYEKAVYKIDNNILATIIYTSGTTGTPKGVMLSHKNLIFAPTEILRYVTAYDTDTWMSILPIWHIGERFFENMGIIHGTTIVLSSVYSLKEDMLLEKPDLIPGVPLVWKQTMNGILKVLKQSGKIKIFYFFYNKSLIYKKAIRIIQKRSIEYKKPGLFKFLNAIFRVLLLFIFNFLGKKLIYNKIRAATGGNLRTATSGGGALPKEVDDFFEILGIPIIDGYGSTETAVLVSIRSDKVVPYSIGKIMKTTEYKILNPDTNKPCTIGEPGLLYLKGHQVFKGYYKEKEKTNDVLKKDGWYKSGDLVCEDIYGNLQYRGRLKDTIVLLNGKNVEPEPIEDSLENSLYIKNAFIIGQDQEALSSLIVPDYEMIQQYCKEKIGIKLKSCEEMQNLPQIKDLINKEIKRIININTGFQFHELIQNFVILAKDFSMNEELTNTMKKKRNVILKKYNTEIKTLFK
jgi:long-chain acyl-CoA synthetase